MNTAKENIALLPEKCFGILLTDRSLIQIRVGETGYHPMNAEFVKDGLATYGAKDTEDLCNILNGLDNITKGQRSAMEWGSQFGWETAGSNPDRYTADGKHKKNIHPFDPTPSKPKEIPQVIITIVGGVAYLKKKPVGTEVIIVDFDNEVAGESPASVALYGAEDSFDNVDQELAEAMIDANY